jgi:hypothetical protein
MPEIYKNASKDELRQYSLNLSNEISNQKDKKSRYDVLDKVMQNTPAESLKKMMQENGYLSQQLQEMHQVYGGEIGKLMKSTEDSTYRDPSALLKSLNYMGTAGKFMDKSKIEGDVKNMVGRFLEKDDAPLYMYHDLNYANLCEAGFSDDAEKILLKGLQEQRIGFDRVMELKEKGLLSDEQVKNLALKDNDARISKEQNSMQREETRIVNFKKALENAEAAVLKNPDVIITVNDYGLGQGRAGDLIVKYREKIAADIKNSEISVNNARSRIEKLAV